MPVVIEVIAKLGETRLDHDHVAVGSTYRIGTTTLVAKPGTHRVGLVDVTMERIFRVETPVGAASFAWRPLIYTAVSLALHVTIWAIAMWTSPFERLPSPVDNRPPLVIRIDEHLDPPPPKPKQLAAAREATDAVVAPPSVKRRAPRDEDAPTYGFMSPAVAKAFQGFVKSIPDVKKQMAQVGPAYNEDDATGNAFGGHLWDIDSDPDFATIKTGPGYDISDLAFSGEWDIGMSKEEKALMKIKGQTALAHKSAIRGDCVPSHRIAKWLRKLDEVAYREIFLGDPEIVYCLSQPVPPSHIKPDPDEGIRSAFVHSTDSGDDAAHQFYQRRH